MLWKLFTDFTEQNNQKMLDTVRAIVQGMFTPDVVYECMDFYREGQNLRRGRLLKRLQRSLHWTDSVKRFLA